jgi:hypothetical protein
MTAVTFTIEPDELLGLSALVTMDKAAGGDASRPGTEVDAVAIARTLMRTALAEQLTETGLPWAPAARSVKARASAAAAQPGLVAAKSDKRADGKKLRRDIAYVVAAVVVVALWGGYSRGWRWTGFQTNGQLWDWLNLLLLPVVTASIPLWIQYRRYMGRARTAAYGAFLIAWTGFVIAAYVIPLRWTGFRGQTLWDWFELLLLPTAVACTMALTSMRVRPTQVLRSMRPYQQLILAALAAGWVVTIIGGYTLGWRWTGYAENDTLWDWLQLLLLPLLFPTVILPALLNWITGNAARRAAETTAVPAASHAAGLPAGSVPA